MGVLELVAAFRGDRTERSGFKDARPPSGVWYDLRRICSVAKSSKHMGRDV